MLPRPLDVASSWTATALRMGSGVIATHAGPRPQKLLTLYEFEACPFCRKAREALTMLDLSVLIRPCPKGGPTFRPEVIRRGGRSMFPFLVDPNTGDEMYESADIIDHLYRNYGNRSAPLWLRSNITVPMGTLASAIRTFRGVRYRPSRIPEQPLELYSFEASPYSRIAREALCELELPYRLINAGRGSPQWQELKARAGRAMVPWLHDPNTGREMFESADIVAYLDDTYAVDP